MPVSTRRSATHVPAFPGAKHGQSGSALGGPSAPMQRAHAAMRRPCTHQARAGPAPSSKRRRLASPTDGATYSSAAAAAAAAAPEQAAAVGSSRGAEAVGSSHETSPHTMETWLVVGLGNPGSTYARTRHNVGFMIVDALAKEEGIECRKLEASAAVGRGTICGQRVVLVKPVTFMNNSGDSVSELTKKYGVPPSRVLVVTDDLDQPTAGIKLKPKGGHGGHNGLRSIIARLGDDAGFPRLKVGIGRPPPGTPVPNYVLQDFTDEEQAAIDGAVAMSCTVVRSVLSLGFERAVSGVGLLKSTAATDSTEDA
ncbi:hypothetical protein FOA52_014906 [Chlamydomonas sp. UWO 241]|nr:hypothetical protein FOA52_014906 [Chlamydomonas sp. UWO 241]